MSGNEDPKKAMSWVRSPSGVVDIYANQAHVTWTLDDVRIRLGQVVVNPETPNPGPGFSGVVEERAAVTFGWRNAKLLRDSLNEIVEAYEAANGEIGTAPSLVQAPNA